MAEKVMQEDDGDPRKIAIVDPSDKRSSENSASLKTEARLKSSESSPADKSQSGIANVPSKAQKKDVDGSASVPDIPEDKTVTDKGLVMTTPQRKSRSACRARSRDPRKCQINFREMIGKHEMRNEELEQLEGDLRERLDMLECSMPAVMVWNVLRMGQGASPTVIRQLMEKQLQGVHPAGNVAIPSTPSQHYDYRVREVEAERKEALKRAEEARALLTDKEAAIEERRKRLEKAKKCNQERKERVERLNREAAELRETVRDAHGDDTSCQAGECGEIRCREKLLGNMGSLSSIGSTDLECFAKLQDLAESEVCMKRQISELERREEAYMKTLQQADELWSKMEGDNAGNMRELQEQLRLKMTANQELADRVCQLEDELEKSVKRLVGCKEELGKYTSKVYTDTEIGFKDGVATAEERGIVAAVKTATSFASASPQTVDTDTTAHPETMDKASSIVPASDEKGVGVIRKMFDKASEATVDLREREVGRPIGLGIDAGVGDAQIGELDDSVSKTDSDEKLKSGRPEGTKSRDKEDTAETIQHFDWDEGYPPDAVVKDMVETSTEMESLQPVKGAFVSDAKVQATVETVERPVGGSEAEDIAEIIREVRISSKVVVGRGSGSTSTIEHTDETTMTEDRRETGQTKPVERVTSPTRIDKDRNAFVERMGHVIDDVRSKIDRRHSGEKSVTKRTKMPSAGETEAQLEDEVDETTYETYEPDSQTRSITRGTEMFDKMGAATVTPREHEGHKPTHETYHPGADKKRGTEYTKISDKNIGADVHEIKGDLEKNIVEIDRPYPAEEADGKRATKYDTDRKVRSDSKKDVEKHPKADGQYRESIADHQARKVDETALKRDESDFEDSDIRKRATKLRDDHGDITAPKEREIEEFTGKTDQLDSKVKSPSARRSVFREDGEAVVNDQGHKVGRTSQGRDKVDSDEKDTSKRTKMVSEVDAAAQKYDMPDSADSDIRKRATKLRDDHGDITASKERKIGEFTGKTDQLDSKVKSPSARRSVFREDGEAVVNEQGHKVGRSSQGRDKADSDKKDASKRTKMVSEVDATAQKYDMPDSADSDIRKRATKLRDDHGDIAAPKERKIEEFTGKTDQLDSKVKSPSARRSEDGEAVVNEQGHKVGRTSQGRDKADSDEKDTSKRTKMVSEVDSTAQKYDMPDSADSDIRKRSTKLRDENQDIVAPMERKFNEFTEATDRHDSTAERFGKHRSVLESGEAVVDELGPKVDETTRRTDKVDSKERDVSKVTKISSRDSGAIVDSAERAVDRRIASNSADDVGDPKVNLPKEDHREGDDVQKTRLRQSEILELEDDEDIPEAWKNWDWDEGCPPDATCTNEVQSRTGKDDAQHSKSFPKIDSKVQASVEMIGQSVGGSESENEVEEERMVTDIDSPSVIKTTDYTTERKLDQVVLSREELRNWYNIVNSVHHKISRCISCKSEVDAIAQLMGKMNNQIRMMALADEEDPIAHEEMGTTLIQMPNIEKEILKDVATEPSEYRKGQPSSSATTAEPNVETIGSIDTGNLDYQNENLNNVLKEANDSPRGTLETTDISVARATILPEDTHSTAEAADTSDEFLETKISKTNITDKPTALDDRVPSAVSLQSLSAAIPKDVEGLVQARSDEKGKLSPSLISTEEELSETLAQQAEVDEVQYSFDGDAQAAETEQPVLISSISIHLVVDKTIEEEMKKPPSKKDDAHTLKETVEEIKSPASWATKDKEAMSQSKLERDKNIQPSESAKLCMCTPPLCHPIITCIRIPHTEGTQTSPQIPRTLNRIKVKPITESIRPPPDVLMWRRPLIWSKRRKDKSTLTAVCADTQTDSALARERVAQRGVDWKDDCTCSGVSPRKTRFGGSDKRVLSHHRDERLPAPVSYTVAELFAPTGPRPGVSPKEKEISVTQYTDKSLTPEDSELCCVECGKPVASEATLVSSNANVRTGTKPQKGLMRTLKKIATSSTSRMARKKDDFTCCACKLLDKDKTEDASERTKKKTEKSSHGKKDDTELCCPCPPGIKEKKTDDASKPSRKRRKPEKKDQSVTANIPRSKFKKTPKDKDGPDRTGGPSKTGSKITSSSSKSGSKHSENTANERIDIKSFDKSRSKVDGSVKQLATKVSGTDGSPQCGCDDDKSVLVPYTNYTAVFKTNLTSSECDCSSSIESASKDGTCNCADTAE